MTCRYDREAEAYLTPDGDPCKRDAYGDPTHHCTARRTCANHVGPGELTCARCLGRVRAKLRRIVEIAPLVTYEALAAGVNSEAASLAGPACDVEAWSWLKIAAKQGVIWHSSMIEDDDDYHPYTVLTRWEFMLREDYDARRDDATSVTSAGAYLDRTLARLAQDDEQDFPLFAREITRCHLHLEAVLRNSSAPTRGAPCPSCEAPAPRLSQVHGHWCWDEACERIHYPQDPDRWVCPRDRSHVWEEDDYRKWVADVYDEARQNASA